MRSYKWVSFLILDALYLKKLQHILQNKPSEDTPQRLAAFMRVGSLHNGVLLQVFIDTGADRNVMDPTLYAALTQAAAIDTATTMDQPILHGTAANPTYLLQQTSASAELLYSNTISTLETTLQLNRKRARCHTLNETPSPRRWTTCFPQVSSDPAIPHGPHLSS